MGRRLFEDLYDVLFTIYTVLEVHGDMFRTVEDDISVSRVNGVVSSFGVSIVEIDHLAERGHVIPEVLEDGCSVA